MTTSATVTFDGTVLRPDQPLDLQANERYVVTITHLADPASEADAWQTLEKLSGTVQAPEDWAEQHDHYLYGTPKVDHEE